ncbi:MAG TPA: beta-ketoacyl synthase N-terminal-like domain-containing protein [Terriglobales bacterium]
MSAPPERVPTRSLAREPIRVVVTGLGALTPAGAGIAACRAWEQAPARYGQQVPGFDPAHYIPSPKLRRSMHRSFELVVAAAVEAMRAAGLPDAASIAAAGFPPARAGVASALADLSPLSGDLLHVLEQIEVRVEARPPAGGADPAIGQPMDHPIAWAQFAELALHQLHPFRRLTLLANMAVAHTSLLFGLQGPSFTFTSGAAGGMQAIAQAAWTIAEGRADLMLCHAAESPDQTFAAAPPPEAAVALVLESWETAQRRQAPILAELLPGAAAPPAGAPGLSPVPGFLAVLLQVDAAPAGAPLPLAALRGVSVPQRPPLPVLGEVS